MKPTRWNGGWSAAALLLAMAIGSGCDRGRQASEEHGHEPGLAHHEEEGTRGPQGGRLFREDDLQLELLIAEDGIPPEYRAYLYDREGRPIEPGQARLAVVLERFGGRRDSLTFRAGKEFLRSEQTVEEPHSFDARLTLDHAGRRHAWSFSQREGRVELLPEAVREGGIEIGIAGPRPIEVRVETPGEVKLNAERVAQVRPRFPGVVQRLVRRLGDHVTAGDPLAVVHSNESLADYTIPAPLTGTIVARDVASGQAVDHETVLYTVADLSNVWVDFALYPRTAGQVRRGQPVHVRSLSGDSLEAAGTISYVGPLLEQDTRVSYGRVALSNRGGRWTPGLYVTAAITVDRVHAAIAVPEDAIVRTTRGTAVFRAAGSTFEMQPVETGRSDGRWTEVLAGLEPGAAIVIRNAYLLKAELGRSGATHDH